MYSHQPAFQWTSLRKGKVTIPGFSLAADTDKYRLSQARPVKNITREDLFYGSLKQKIRLRKFWYEDKASTKKVFPWQRQQTNTDYHLSDQWWEM